MSLNGFLQGCNLCLYFLFLFYTPLQTFRLAPLVHFVLATYTEKPSTNAPIIVSKQTNLYAKNIEINLSMKLQIFSLFEVRKLGKSTCKKE